VVGNLPNGRLRKHQDNLDTIALGQTIIAALLLATQFAPQPHVSSGVSAQGGLSYGVPLAAFVVMVISLAAGYWMLAVGGLYPRAQVRISVIALIVGLLAIQPVTTLTGRDVGGPYSLGKWLSIGQLGALGALLLWAGARKLTSRRVARSTPHLAGEEPSGGAVSGRPVFIGAFIALMVYYGLEFGIWLAFVQAGQAGTGAGILLHSISAEVLLLPLALVLPILAFSTDWVNRAQRAVRHAAFFREGRRGKLSFARPMPYVVGLVAVALLGYEIWHATLGLLGGLVAIIVIAAITARLVRFARIDWDWPLDVSSGWVFAAAAFYFVDALLLVDLNPFSPGLPSLVVNTVAALLPVPIALGGLTLALVLIIKGRAGRPDLGVGGLLLAVVALVILAASYPAALDAAGLPVPQPSDFLGAVDIWVAVTVLGWLALMWKRGEWSTHTVRLRNTLVLLIGLWTVRGGYGLLRLVARIPAQYTVLLAALFLLPSLWVYLLPTAQRRLAKPLRTYAPGLAKLVGVLDGGEKSDGSQDDPSARATDLMKTGYLLIATCMIVYLGTFREPVSGGVLPSFLQGDLTASGGLLLLGPPVVVLAFVLRLWHRRPRRADPKGAAGAAVAGPAAVGRGRRVVAGAVAVTLAATVALLVSALPRSVQASENRPYTAALPSANCDDGDAYWTLTAPAPLGLDCGDSGLTLTVPAHETNAMTFIPPDGYFRPNYQASVRVDFVRLARGCLSVETRMTSIGYYFYNICNTGTWTVNRYTGVSRLILADGVVAPADSYVLTVTADGVDQRLAIGGQQVATVADPDYQSTQSLAVGIQNLTGQPGVAAISHFAYQPFGQTATMAAAASYFAPRPGPGCDLAAAQWALLDPSYARVSCQPTGTTLAMSADVPGELGFTPPGGTFPADYGVSVTANLRRLPGGCVEVGVRMVGVNGYRDAICADGDWSIDESDGSAQPVLAHGAVTQAASYTIEAITDGDEQSLAVNGVTVARVRSSSLATTAYVLVAAGGQGPHPGSAVLSDFAFTPLP
jgi:hypothetical protein